MEKNVIEDSLKTLVFSALLRLGGEKTDHT
jgi:hypothetical protein